MWQQLTGLARESLAAARQAAHPCRLFLSGSTEQAHTIWLLTSLPFCRMQVEGLADLLAAETESQRRQALLHSTGEPLSPLV